MSQEAYHVPASEVNTEIIIKKSRFLTHLKPVKNEAEAKAYIDKVRSEHKTANHNVPAVIIREPGKPIIERCSDDGEPSGTAGKPVLEVLKREGLTNVAVVITRYFGGILLGSGGLVRAYSEAAKAGVDEAGKIAMEPYTVITFEIDYPLFNGVRRLILDKGNRMGDIQYNDSVMVSAFVKAGNEEELKQGIINLTAGTTRVQVGETIFFPAALD